MGRGLLLSPRTGLSEPVFYLGDRKGTVKTWVGGRQIPSVPGHQAQARC